MSRSATRLGVLVALLVLGGRAVATQRPDPGYIDPGPFLQVAAKTIGTDTVKCLTISGASAYSGLVGQQRDASGEWPRGEMTKYTRQINFDTRTMKEEFDRKPGMNPRSWKWGWGGWIDGTPLQQNARQIFMVNGNDAWHYDGPGTEPIPAPELAELWQLELWLNPHGFLKAARMPGANPVATWRWELDEMGRGPDNEFRKERVTVVSITMLGKYRVNATFTSNNVIRRIQTWIADPVHGQLNYEHESTEFRDFGGGITFPTVWHHHAGWDDNFHTQNYSGGHNAFGGTLDNVQPNVCPDPVTVPESVRKATVPPVRVEVEKIGDGVYLIGGGTHNSVAVEFNDFVAVVEAPLSERRSLAVIEEVARIAPNKPIRFLVNTHQHYDHIGGLRTYHHIGSTIVTHRMNAEFYQRDVINYAPRVLQPDLVSLMPPTELAEGYVYEPVTDEFTISDRRRNMHLYWVRPVQHVVGMLMAYLPHERMVIEADLLDTHVPLASTMTPANRSLLNMVNTLKLDVARIVPIHGKPISWAEFAKLGTN